MMESYVQVFQEAFLAAIWPMQANTTLYAYGAFGSEGLFAHVVVAIIGSVCGLLVLMYLGKQFWRLIELNGPQFVADRRNEKVDELRVSSAYAAILLWTPFSFIIGVAAGFFDADKHKAIVSGAIGMILYYCYQLFV
ncbi:MAG: hypothetical protein MRY32_03890 [Rickettsiales bacterium]|nr:hypothetical protein [Rickettsiales bacterium]